MEKIFSVSEFITEINTALAFPVVVEGEVSSFNVSQGKWVFFDLKDEKVECKVACFMVLWNLKTELADGMRVRIYGCPKIHDKSGKFSITVDKIELVGEGALKRAYELLFTKLKAEGLFAPERKRVLPKFPDRIGLIASRESDAYADFLRILGNRWGGVEVVLMHVQVQGAAAVSQISSALKYFSSTEAPSVQAVVLVRGGGSLEDLQAFNTEEVARAIYASRVPIIVGVGHEKDETIADYTADLRASTPSNAAERLFPDRREVLIGVNHQLNAICSGFDYTLANFRYRVNRSVETVSRSLLIQSARVQALANALGAHFLRMSEKLLHYNDKVEMLVRSIGNMHPERVLSRGYAIVRAKGRVIKKAGSLATGSQIDVQLAEGAVGALVTSIK